MRGEPAIRLGTAAFTAAGWEGTFYPEGLAPGEAIRHYAEEFDTVEVDSTFYRVPNPRTIEGWNEKTPEGFIFALKVPRTITHEKVLQDCERELWEFLAAIDPLGEKIGPLLFQFPYFNKKAFNNVEEFLDRLAPFLERLPKAYRFALDLRNKYWFKPPLLDLLREQRVALALVDHPWMLHPKDLMEKMDPVTTDFTYVRWLGDWKKMEEQTKVWNQTLVDRTEDLREWVDVLRGIRQRGTTVFAFANNHYAGYAPDTARLVQKLWGERGHE